MSGAVRQLLAVSLFLVTLLYGCNSYDSDYIPYGITAMDVYVYNHRTDEEHFGGRVTGNYFSRASLRGQCGNLAHDVARHYHLEDWSYVCCTVTSSSGCVTKVR